MDFSKIDLLALGRIKVRALVKCGDDYIFIQRCKFGKTKKFLTFPGGRVKKSDKTRAGSEDILHILKMALVRELEEELAAQDIHIGPCLGISKLRDYDREVLFRVDVGSYDWDARTGKEFSNPDKGTYDLILVQSLTKDVLGKKALHLKPKEWRKLLYTLG